MGTLPRYTSPVVPEIVMKSPRFTVWPLQPNVPAALSIVISEAPTTAGMPHADCVDAPHCFLNI